MNVSPSMEALMKILPVGFVVLLLAAVPGDDSTRAGVKPSPTDALMLYYPNDPNTINPILAGDTVSEEFERWVIDTLAEQKCSNPDEWEPSLAEKWEFDEKTLEYTIHL